LTAGERVQITAGTLSGMQGIVTATEPDRIYVEPAGQERPFLPSEVQRDPGAALR